MNIISRKQARAAGLRRYFTGKPCKRGHVAERHASSAYCLECKGGHYQANKDAINEQKRKYRQENKDAIVEIKRKHYQANKEAITKRTREHYQNNKAALAERARDYQRKHPEKRRANDAKRRAAKNDRLPAWYSDEDRQHEELLHTACKAMLQIFGETWHVDHVYPLQGRKVSGLHCGDNLQLLCEHDNTSKNNKHPDDWTRPAVDLRKYHDL